MKQLLMAEPEEDPGLEGQATGNSGWVLLLGTGDGDGVVLDYDPRNAALVYALDYCGARLSHNGILYDPGADLVFAWTQAHVWEDDMEFAVFDEVVLVEDAWLPLAEEWEADEVSPEIEWPEIYPLHLGLTHANCSHLWEPTGRPRPLSLTGAFEDRGDQRCVLCGWHARRSYTLSDLRRLAEQRSTGYQPCAFCGEPFKPKVVTQVNCSSVCRVRRAEQRRKARGRKRKSTGHRISTTPYRCPCGERDPARYQTGNHKRCVACDRRHHRNGSCGSCGRAMYSRNRTPYCERGCSPTDPQPQEKA